MTWTSIRQTEHLPQDTPDSVNISREAPTSGWEYGVYVVSQVGDVCREGSWVFYERKDATEFQVCHYR